MLNVLIPIISATTCWSIYARYQLKDKALANNIAITSAVSTVSLACLPLIGSAVTAAMVGTSILVSTIHIAKGRSNDFASGWLFFSTVLIISVGTAMSI